MLSSTELASVRVKGPEYKKSSRLGAEKVFQQRQSDLPGPATAVQLLKAIGEKKIKISVCFKHISKLKRCSSHSPESAREQRQNISQTGDNTFASVLW